MIETWDGGAGLTSPAASETNSRRPRLGSGRRHRTSVHLPAAAGYLVRAGVEQAVRRARRSGRWFLRGQDGCPDRPSLLQSARSTSQRSPTARAPALGRLRLLPTRCIHRPRRRRHSPCPRNSGHTVDIREARPRPVVPLQFDVYTLEPIRDQPRLIPGLSHISRLPMAYPCLARARDEEPAGPTCHFAGASGAEGRNRRSRYALTCPETLKGGLWLGSHGAAATWFTERGGLCTADSCFTTRSWPCLRQEAGEPSTSSRQ
ncbi:hypothetical protein ABIA35_001088 [Catenulispora sp. MAP12-49]